jgi:plastocyanin
MTRTMSRTTLLVLTALVIGAVLILSRPGEDPTVASEAGQIEIVMEDYGFVPADVTLPVEQPLELTFVNRDDAPHHVSFGRAPVIEGVDACFGDDLFEGLSPVVLPSRALVAGDDDAGTFEFLVEPQETVEVRVELPADREGEWEMGCFTARGAHFRAGLSGTVHVVDAA